MPPRVRKNKTNANAKAKAKAKAKATRKRSSGFPPQKKQKLLRAAITTELIPIANPAKLRPSWFPGSNFLKFYILTAFSNYFLMQLFPKNVIPIICPKFAINFSSKFQISIGQGWGRRLGRIGGPQPWPIEI